VDRDVRIWAERAGNLYTKLLFSGLTATGKLINSGRNTMDKGACLVEVRAVRPNRVPLRGTGGNRERGGCAKLRAVMAERPSRVQGDVPRREGTASEADAKSCER
jgi:hypothetical protein